MGHPPKSKATKAGGIKPAPTQGDATGGVPGEAMPELAGVGWQSSVKLRCKDNSVAGVQHSPPFAEGAKDGGTRQT
ncbi:MAG: hypothetical protein WBD87_08325 [Candidatus Acidiferrales bacterium]